MARLKVWKYIDPASQKGKEVAINISTNGKFSARIETTDFEEDTLEKLRGKLQNYVATIPDDEEFWPIIKIEEHCPHADGAPFVCFTFERFHITPSGRSTNSWAEPDGGMDPDIEEDRRHEDCEPGEKSRKEIEIEELGGYDGYIRDHLRKAWHSHSEEIFARKYPVIVRDRTETTIYIPYNLKTWLALKMLQDKVGELRDALILLWGNEKRLQQIGSSKGPLLLGKQ